MWEIYAYQNADSLFGIFNAAATIHGSGDYMAAVAAVAFCGFIAALVAYAFAPEKLQGWKWLATVLLVFSVLIVPRVTVGVVDKTGGSAVKVVANVPFGVAFLGSVTSTVGHTLTGLFGAAIFGFNPFFSYIRHGDLEWSLRPRTRIPRPATAGGVPAGRSWRPLQGGAGPRGRRDHSRSPWREQAIPVLKPPPVA